MRTFTLLILTATAATTAASTAAAQTEARERSAAEARAAAAARADRQRDSLRVRGVGFEAEIERVVAELIATAQMRARAEQEFRLLTTRRVEEARRQQVQLNLQSLQEQAQLLRSKLASLCDGNAKPQGYMGITFSATMSADAAASGAEVFRFEENPTVETVEPGSPAERAGVAKGDEIITIGGQNVVGREIVFTRLLRPGNRLPIRLRRDGDTRDVTLTITKRPPALDNGCPFLDARIMAAFGDPLGAPSASKVWVGQMPGGTGGTVRVRTARTPEGSATVATGGSAVTSVTPPPPMVPSITLLPPNGSERGGERSFYVVSGTMASQRVIAGATIVRPNADLRETFGVKSGVLVLDVARGSPAAVSGLKGGDIIIAAGRAAVTTPAAIQQAMESADSDQITLRIIRKKKPQTITLRW